MNRSYVFLVLSLFIFLSAPVLQAEDFPPPTDSIEVLLEKLPAQDRIQNARKLVRNKESADPKELENAQELLKLTSELVPKIRTLLQVGKSVLDYPGLLAHGKIQYAFARTGPSGAGGEARYTLYLGYFAGPEGTGTSDFELLFDEKGTIREINSVSWKK